MGQVMSEDILTVKHLQANKTLEKGNNPYSA